MLTIYIKSDWSNPVNAKRDVLDCLKKPNGFKLSENERIMIYMGNGANDSAQYKLVMTKDGAFWYGAVPPIKQNGFIEIVHFEHYYASAEDPT